MLDKRSEIFLNFLESRPDKNFIYYEEPEYPEELGDNNDLFALIRYLEKTGYLEIIETSSGADMGVRLSHKGVNRKEMRLLEKKERWKERAWGFISGVLMTVLAGLILSWFSQLPAQQGTLPQTQETSPILSVDHP